MKKVFQDISVYLIISIIFLSVGGMVLMLTEKQELHLFLNQFHAPVFDFFFKYFTHVGDGIFAALVLPVILFVYRKKVLHNFIIGALLFVLVPLIVQYLKRVVFYKEPRPVRVFGEDSLYLVPGVEVSHVHTFPSGHATAIFAFFIFLSYVFREKKQLQYFFGVAAILGAYSRVYLSFHFMEDILAGALLGVTCFIVSRALLIYPLNKIDARN